MQYPKLSLILGGAASGKSNFAEKLVIQTKLPRSYLATAQALDDDMYKKIQLHQRDRGPGWATTEAPIELPDAFLRRCFFHYIQFPDRPTMEGIVKVHYPKIKKALVKDALDLFFDVRKIPGMKKKPSTSELIDWLKLLMSDELPDEILKNADTSKAIPPLYGALLKNEQDVQLLERLAFMSRRDQAK